MLLPLNQPIIATNTIEQILLPIVNINLAGIRKCLINLSLVFACSKQWILARRREEGWRVTCQHSRGFGRSNGEGECSCLRQFRCFCLRHRQGCQWRMLREQRPEARVAWWWIKKLLWNWEWFAWLLEGMLGSACVGRWSWVVEMRRKRGLNGTTYTSFRLPLVKTFPIHTYKLVTLPILFAAIQVESKLEMIL